MSEYIERQAAIDAIARMMPSSYTPDGSHPADEEIFKAQEIFADCIESIEIMPAADVVPVVRCKDCVHFIKLKLSDGHWCDNDYGMCDDDPNGFCSHGKRREE